MYRAHPFKRRALVNLYAAFIRPGDLCFDIGAHIGSHLSIWLKLGARVLAVEPNPACARILRAVYGRSAVIVETAAWDSAGTQKLFISTRSPTLSTLRRDWIETVRHKRDFSRNRWDDTVEVRTITLDGLIDRYGKPGFCKIDVEGAEDRVLQGLTQPLPGLSFEYISAAIEPAVGSVDRLSDLASYVFNWIPGEGGVFQSAAWLGSAEMKRELRKLSKGRGSGDVYAMLC
jgi:FkbM family methyltransferase